MMDKVVRQIKKLDKKYAQLFRISIVILVIAVAGGATASAHYFSMKTPQPKPVAQIAKPKSVKTVTPAPTTTSTTASNAATSAPTVTPTVTPAPVPQTVSNNQHLALLCSQAQGSYDQLSVSALNQEESEVSAADGDASQINQINQTYDSEVAGEYAGYLEQVQAVPGCVADFSAPTPFPMLSTN